MPSYSTDPTELQAEIRALPITLTPMPVPDDQQLAPADEALVAEIFPHLEEGNPRAIRTLRNLVERYPGVPSLKNHLSTAYFSAGRNRKGRQIIDQLRRENPDYLFGHLNHAGGLLGRSGARQRIPEILGETLRLRDLKPDVELFHESEVRGFYNIVAHFHLEEGRPQPAMAICQQLLKSTTADDPQLHQLHRAIGMANLQSMQQRMADDAVRAIRTVVPPIPLALPDTPPPEFHHPQIAALYHHGFDIPQALIAEILALPRTTLIADLQAVLQDSITRAPLFLEELVDSESCELFFPLHAIFFLGELRAGEALPSVLAVLSQHPDVLNLWYGERLYKNLWEPVLHLVEDQLDAGLAFLLAPGISSAGRDVVATAVARIALFQAGRRTEILAWFRSALEFFLDSPPEDNVLDTQLISDLVWILTDLQATELLPLIAALYEKGYIAESHVGNLESITTDMGKPPLPAHLPKLMNLQARYRHLITPRVPNRPPQSGDAEDLAPSSEPGRQAPATRAPQVGRNAPCPCGSGKKHKKCCL